MVLGQTLQFSVHLGPSSPAAVAERALATRVAATPDAELGTTHIFIPGVLRGPGDDAELSQGGGLQPAGGLQPGSGLPPLIGTPVSGGTPAAPMRRESSAGGEGPQSRLAESPLLSGHSAREVQASSGDDLRLDVKRCCAENSPHRRNSGPPKLASPPELAAAAAARPRLAAAATGGSRAVVKEPFRVQPTAF